MNHPHLIRTLALIAAIGASGAAMTLAASAQTQDDATTISTQINPPAGPFANEDSDGPEFCYGQ